MYGETDSIKCLYKEKWAYRDQILVTAPQNTSKFFYDYGTNPTVDTILEKRNYRENLASVNMQNVKGASMKIWRKHLPCG
jgi:hypothetical protein